MSEDKIYKAMSGILADVKAIGKASKNEQQGFMFRGVDTVMDCFHPIFAKHKVFIMPEVMEERTEERKTKNGGNLIWRILKITFHFIADDGSQVSGTAIGEGMDGGDKAANKAMAVALKYVLSQSFLLAYNEADPDQTTPEPSKPKSESPKLSAGDIKWLKMMADCKKGLGDEMYYAILGEHGYESSKEIKEKPARKAVYEQMTTQIEANAETAMEEK